MFDCDGCGMCCRSVGHLKPFLDSVDGVCVKFDTNTNRCKIYATRPLICRVDDYWEANLQNIITKDEWYKANEDACKKLLSNEIK